MNIFYLDHNPYKAAQYHCDKHVVKMILESAQLLSTAHRVLDGNDYADGFNLYKSTHINHPCSVWVRESYLNYEWLYWLMVNLCSEYTGRYNKIHKSSSLLKALCISPTNLPYGVVTNPPQCMPEEYKNSDTVTAYRNYYIGDKSSFAKWTNRNVPTWWK